MLPARAQETVLPVAAQEPWLRRWISRSPHGRTKIKRIMFRLASCDPWPARHRTLLAAWHHLVLGGAAQPPCLILKRKQEPRNPVGAVAPSMATRPQPLSHVRKSTAAAAQPSAILALPRERPSSAQQRPGPRRLRVRATGAGETAVPRPRGVPGSSHCGRTRRPRSRRGH